MTSDSKRAFYDERAPRRALESKRRYHQLVAALFRNAIPPGKRVLEVGCGFGDLLNAVHPSDGVGVDFSPATIERARERHPHLQFNLESAEAFSADADFDYIILSDLVNDLEDVQSVLERLASMSHPDTRLVINFYNGLWRPILGAAEGLGLKAPNPPQNWLSVADMKNLLRLAGWEPITTRTRILAPVPLLGIDRLLNRWIAPLIPALGLTSVLIARPKPEPYKSALKCSIVIPARNEAGNIEAAVQRVPEMGAGVELIFVEGGSEDETFAEIERVQNAYPTKEIVSLRQTGKGKGDAVRAGFAKATGDLFFILDADLTVPPEDLPKFYKAARDRTGDFINGVRLVYPMEAKAMRFINMLGNKFFSALFTWLLERPTKDTLCGTKVLHRSTYEAIAANRDYFGDFDPFGDFDLLFGAARLNQSIVDLPIRYKARVYGDTNIDRWRHGLILIRMAAFAARRLKFVKTL